MLAVSCPKEKASCTTRREWLRLVKKKTGHALVRYGTGHTKMSYEKRHPKVPFEERHPRCLRVVRSWPIKRVLCDGQGP